MKILIQVGNAELVVHAEKIADKVWIHSKGKTYAFEDGGRARSSRAKKHHDAHSLDIVAPMPGKVTKILVEQGVLVTKGQAMLVMEAMKMEYTLKAAADGIVQGVRCAVQEQVTLGRVLVEVEEVKSN